MAALPAFRIQPTARPRRPRFFVKVVAVVCVVAVLAEVAIFTSGFGLAGLLAPPRTASSGPNPFDEPISGVSLQVDYLGSSSGYYTLPDGPQLCGPCPVVPTVNPTFSPPVAGLWVYFNVTSSSANYTDLTGFALVSSGANASLFALSGVVCCYPAYLENVEMVGFSSGATEGLAFYADATLIPDDGPGGYALTLTASSS